jgi:hypothetical protein
MLPCLANIGVDAAVECCVWLKIAVQVGPNAPMHRHNESAMQRTATFVVICC